MKNIWHAASQKHERTCGEALPNYPPVEAPYAPAQGPTGGRYSSSTGRPTISINFSALVEVATPGRSV
jgi:hypothetical protein